MNGITIRPLRGERGRVRGGRPIFKINVVFVFIVEYRHPE